MDIVYLETGSEKEILETLDTLIPYINLVYSALAETTDDDEATLNSGTSNQQVVQVYVFVPPLLSVLLS
jgi:hypothetical protein